MTRTSYVLGRFRVVVVWSGDDDDSSGKLELRSFFEGEQLLDVDTFADSYELAIRATFRVIETEGEGLANNIARTLAFGQMLELD